METPRIDKATGEFERKGTCEGCGDPVTRTKTISASSYEEMLAAGEEWGQNPLVHARCEHLVRRRRDMSPSKWRSHSGKVHHRRLRFWVGTSHETKADPNILTMLCGAVGPRLSSAPADAIVDCGVCIKAAKTQGHLP